MSSDEQVRAALRRPQRPAPDEAGAYERFLRRRTALRRRVQVTVAVGAVLLILGGVVAVRLLPLAAPAVVPPAGPPAAGAPRTFVGQIVRNGKPQTAIIDVNSGRIVRLVPGVERVLERRPARSLPIVLSPDLRTMYVWGGSTPPQCGTIKWTQVDLATGATHPAFGGLTGLGTFSLSADGRSMAFVRTMATSAADAFCPTELVVRDLATGRQRVWTIPAHDNVLGLQLSPDATQLVYTLSQESAGTPPIKVSRQSLHVLPLVGTTSVTQGRDLPPVGANPCTGATTARFLGGSERLLVLELQGCRNGSYSLQRAGNLLFEYNLRTGRVSSITPLDLPPSDVLNMDVDRSGKYVIFGTARNANTLHPGIVYVLRDGRLKRVPFSGDCWQADW
jgi:hypothetical protein